MKILIFKGEIAIKVGFNIEIRNEDYDETVIREKISDVMDDAMGACWDDDCVRELLSRVVTSAMSTRSGVTNVVVTKSKVFNRENELFVKCEAEFDCNENNNDEIIDVSSIFEDHFTYMSGGKNAFFDIMYLYAPNESECDFVVEPYFIRNEIYSKAEIVGD